MLEVMSFRIRRRALLVLTMPWLLAPAAARAEIEFTLGQRPIFQHVKNGDAQQVRRLLLGGESANQIDAKKMPLIVAAAISGHPDVLEVILRHGVLIDGADPDGNTALMAASERGDGTIVEMILRYRPRINARNRYGMTALMLAAREGHADVAQQLIKAGIDVNAADYTGRNALFYARQSRRGGVEPVLLKAGAR